MCLPVMTVARHGVAQTHLQLNQPGKQAGELYHQCEYHIMCWVCLLHACILVSNESMVYVKFMSCCRRGNDIAHLSLCSCWIIWHGLRF